MRKLALSDEILLSVQQPARYLGNEMNVIVKDPSKVDIRFAMCFPDVYEIGMSHLGIQILYDMFNKREDMWCERVYSPWPDLDRVMREQNIPLFGLESQEPVKNEDFLFITLQYEMCYTNILQVLDLSGIPLKAKERTMEDPFVIGGGPCSYNPEPIADFFDMFYIGEGETQYRRMMDEYKEWKKSGQDRVAFLKRAAQIPGIYVPMFYEASYNEDGTLADFQPIVQEAPKTVMKEVEMDMEHTYKLLEQSNRAAVKMAMFAAIVLVLFALGAYCLIQKSRTKSEEQQEQLQKAVEAADAANEAKSVFLFNVSHDIRTPMNAIIGYAELADRNLDKKELLRSYLEKIGICGQKMLSILDNVLELSRIETGNVVLEESAAEAESVLDDCLHMVSAEIEKKHQTLTVSKDIIYPYIYMDISRFTEIILNLISNAIKYMDRGKGMKGIIQIRVKDVGDFVQVEIEDNGKGIAAKDLPYIFDRFYRTDVSRNSAKGGSGIGLSIVRKILEDHGGKVWATSREDIGTIMYFVLRKYQEVPVNE